MQPVSSSAYSFYSLSSSSSSSSLPSSSGSSAFKERIKRKREEEYKEKSEFDEKESKVLSAMRVKRPHTTKATLASASEAPADPQHSGLRHGLFEDAWIEILQYLPGQEVYATWTRVNKYFNALAPQAVIQFGIPSSKKYHEARLSTILKGLSKSPLQQVHLARLSEYSPSDVYLLKPFPLESLSTCDFRFNEALNFEEALNPKTLKTLEIWGGLSGDKLSKDTLKSLRVFSLTSLTLHYVKLQNSSLAYLPPTLEKLNLTLNRTLSSLSKLNTPRLKELQLRGCSISNESMEKFNEFATLEILDLADCPISDGVQWLTHHPIRILSLAKTGISDEHLKLLPPTTTRLSLCLCTNITNVGMKSLARLSLVMIDLGWLSINDEGIENLGKQPFLEKLNLRNIKITDEALETLGTFSSLQCLDISGCEITADKLKSLLPLKKLKKLVLPDALNTALRVCFMLLDPKVKPLVTKLVRDCFYLNFKYLLEK